jgi:hypothetical protein
VRSRRGCSPAINQIHTYHLQHTMPPPKRVHISPNEGSILLALSAFTSGQCASISAAAKIYNVSKTTLIRRLHGGATREQFTPPNRRMTIIEEEVLVRDILKLDAQGLSPTLSLIREMADAICRARNAPQVGIKWASSFVKRTLALEVKLGRTYECQRKLCEDPERIRAWFELVKNTINKHGILPGDTYDFDETGFQMGQISASKVVTAVDRVGRPKQIKPTNTEWVTLIQGACTDGSLIPPFIIMKGKEFNQAWFYQGLPSTWTFSVSTNGWTTNQIGLQWIQHFEKHTRAKTTGSKRLLILDNHDSHTTLEFRTFCEDKNIVLLWMPPHSSHLLQPLDVGCFGPLKTAFSKQNQNLIRNHIFHVTKVDFLSSFYTAFLASFTRENVKAGFSGSGLHPFDPEVVLSQLDPVLESLSLPSSQESWCTKTPKNTQEVDKQTTLIKKRLERHQSSSPTPIYEALSQLSKGAQIMAASTALMQSQITALQQANEAMHTRRTRKRKAIQSDCALSVAEVQATVIQTHIEAEIREETPRPKKRTSKCSGCGQQGHTIRTCTNRE